MKVLYIHQYFRTPDEGGAIRSYYLAKGMVDNGIEVELITSHNKKYEEVNHRCIPVPPSDRGTEGKPTRIDLLLRLH